MSSIYTNAPSRLRSYVFWSNAIKENSSKDLFKGFSFEEDHLAFIKKFGEKCPFCGGFQQFINTDTKTRMYCICSMSAWLDAMHAELADVETITKPALLNELKPLASQPGAKTLVETKQILAQWVKDPQEWFLIMGGTGNGKTHILRAMKNYFKSAAVYISAEDFNSAIFRALGNREEPLDVLVDKISFVPILLFDDFGIEHTNKMFTDTFAQIINKRYNAGRNDFPLMVTTNLSISDMLNSPDIAMRRIASRLMEEGNHVIKFDQPDYRLATTVKR